MFAKELLIFLRNNKDKYGYYFQSHRFEPECEVTSNSEELIIVTRGGNEDECDWCPNTIEVCKMERDLECDCPMSIVVWTRPGGSEVDLNEIYNAAKLLPELIYIIARRHPGGISSVEMCFSDIYGEDHNTEDYNFIINNINAL